MGKTQMVILAPILIGLYLVLVVGYFKMVVRAVPDLQDMKVMTGIISALWPLALVYTLLKEAIT